MSDCKKSLLIWQAIDNSFQLNDEYYEQSWCIYLTVSIKRTQRRKESSKINVISCEVSNDQNEQMFDHSICIRMV